MHETVRSIASTQPKHMPELQHQSASTHFISSMARCIACRPHGGDTKALMTVVYFRQKPRENKSTKRYKGLTSLTDHASGASMSLSGPAFRSSLSRHSAAFFLMIGRTAPLVCTNTMHKCSMPAQQQLLGRQACYAGLAALSNDVRTHAGGRNTCWSINRKHNVVGIASMLLCDKRNCSNRFWQCRYADMRCCIMQTRPCLRV